MIRAWILLLMTLAFFITVGVLYLKGYTHPFSYPPEVYTFLLLDLLAIVAFAASTSRGKSKR